MKKHVTLLAALALASVGATAQGRAGNEPPCIETRARVDTLVIPDRIYLSIVLAEKDTKGRRTVEELETRMAERLTRLGIDVKRQLSLVDLGSHFGRYFLKQQEVLKETNFSLLLYDAESATRVLIALEEEGISNVSIARTEYAREKELRLELKRRAVARARQHAEAMIAPLGQRAGKAIYLSDSPQAWITGQVAGLRAAKSNSAKGYDPLDVEFQKIQVTEEVIARFLID
ncbi:MAG: SIMPL domain-containing protein [Odoribacteraceae bacterium]|nr:SIMPL domain-containing protein [Odoribacteraceae bacterium]